MSRCLITLLTILLFSGCFRVEEEEVLLQVPQLAHIECAEELQRDLEQVQGVVSVQTDIQNQQVMVKFNSVTVARKNIEFVVAGAGFAISNADAPVSEEERKKLPQNCR